MELTRTLVEQSAREYEREAPFYTVEQESIETLPAAFENGEFGRRDAIWVVEWYYRRELGTISNPDRRALEDEFEENERREIKGAVVDAANADTLDAAIDSLTALSGVDISVASAFLFFIDPDRYLVVSGTEWGVLHDANHLSEPYPDPPTLDEYVEYLDVCRTLADRFGHDLWTLYQALRRLSDH